MKLPTDYIFIDGHIVEAKQIGNFTVVSVCRHTWIKRNPPRFYLPDSEVCRDCVEDFKEKA